MGFWSKVVEVLSYGDWISPTVGLIEDACGMDSITVVVPGYTVNELVRTLRRNGVKVGRTPQLIDGQAVMTVDDASKAWAVIDRIRGW